MAENSINLPKKRLFNGCDLLPRAVPRTANKLKMVLTLYVKNYEKLKNNNIYYTSAEICRYWWTSKLVIVNETLFCFMSTNANVKNPTCRIHKARGDFVINSNIIQIGRLLIAEFCNIAIKDSKNGYLHINSLLLEFGYEIKRSENSSFQTLIDRHAHCDEYKDLYFPHLKADLIIQVEDVVFSCHIAVLTECSKYLADFFRKNKPLSNKITYIDIDDDSDVYEFVMNYIYTGLLDCLDELDMRQVQKVASILQIDSLEKKCREYFATNSCLLK